MTSEIHGGLALPFVRLLSVQAKESRAKSADGSTQYGESRASTRDFMTYHATAIQ